MLLLVHSAKQVVTITSTGKPFLIGDDMKQIEVLEYEGGVSIVVNRNGLIEEIGSNDVISRKYENKSFETKIDARGMCIIPGFIDPHTHPVWEGDRVNEFAMKLAGATYLDIHQSGGGIHFTVEKTTNSSDDQLLGSLVSRLTKMMQAGTTMVECKSGYGLETNAEMRMLKIIDRARAQVAIDISSTYCGAHAVPKGKTAEEATNNIVNDQIPELQRLIEAKEVQVNNIDVFCEKGVFNTQQSRTILQAGKSIGLNINFHGDELYPTKSAEMGAELGAMAISHLEMISEEGIAAMAASKSVAIILPTTAYIMHLKPPPVRKLIDAGVPVALGSDFNPNAYCLAMPIVMNLACVTLGMSMPEALIAATLNASAALGCSRKYGSLEPQKFADFIIIDAPSWEHIIYQFGDHREVINTVIKSGRIVYKKAQNN